MKILSLEQIRKALSVPKILEAIEKGFLVYSQGEAVIPPVASLQFKAPPGECHIKYGYAKKGKYYVVKIASGFYDNPKQGLSSNNGLLLLFDKQTGVPVCALLDEGYLTDVRTAAAGYVAAKYLAPKIVSCVGIIGTGVQAYYQLKYLSFATKCRKVMLWGRDLEKARKFANHSELNAWSFEIAEDTRQLAAACNLIVTATASSHPLLLAEHVKPGTHITAVGADDRGKQELDERIFLRADRVIVDSRSQCAEFGDSSHALKKGMIEMDKLVELGEVLANPNLGRRSEGEMTVCDLTGIAIQDLQIAESIYC
ncbi:MAG: deaminase [Candidatus Protochlamydia sp.]|nr:deaminase [Candidatus Protochlamydia sp.]